MRSQEKKKLMMNGKKICPKCKVNPSPLSQYGVIWCDDCNRAKGKTIGKPFEFTTDSIKKERYDYKKDIVQPFRGDTFSQEFKDTYPEISRGMVKEGALTKKQFNNAKPVWKGDVPGW